MYFVYILKCADKSFYTGITTNIEKRLEKHKNGTASKYTRVHGALKIVYKEKHKNRSIASKREFEIKSWDRKKKIELIENSK